MAIKDGQECLKEFPVIVLGSGASIPEGLPSMRQLADYLKGSMSNRQLSNTDESLWHEFIAKLDDTKDLENVLQGTQLSDKLSKDRARYCHSTGFSYGYLRHRQQRDSRLRFKQGDQTARTVEIWKVHGCLDWFIDPDDQVRAVTSARTIPNTWSPAIVTPGINKYESTHREPFRSIIDGADNALENANAYLCVGFGFNDKHIQPKLLERWKQGNAFLVILTRTLSKDAKEMLKKSNNSEFLALEKAKNGNGTYMRSHRYPEGKQLEGVHLWQFSDFLEQTIGRGN